MDKRTTDSANAACARPKTTIEDLKAAREQIEKFASQLANGEGLERIPGSSDNIFIMGAVVRARDELLSAIREINSEILRKEKEKPIIHPYEQDFNVMPLCKGDLTRFKVGDHVRFIGRIQDDAYNGASCGRAGIVRRVEAWVGVDYDADGSIYAAGAEFLQHLCDCEPMRSCDKYVAVPREIWKAERRVLESAHDVCRQGVETVGSTQFRLYLLAQAEACSQLDKLRVP